MKEKTEKTEINNLRFYEFLRLVPQHALKTIGAGRLKGMSDINPVWRIKAMTECFGPCGIGWKYEVTKQWQEPYGQEVKAFCNINLYIKVDGAWSDPIPGTGGATLVEVNSKGYLYVNDEGHKMALTDAMSVAMRSLGVAADVYFSKDKDGQFDTKYDQQQYASQQVQPQNSMDEKTSAFADIKKATDKASLLKVWNSYPGLQKDVEFLNAMSEKKKQL